MKDMERVATTPERLQEAMTAANKKQIDLARETGLSHSTISRYLSGQVEPRQEAIIKLAKSLNVSEWWLYGYKFPMDRNTAEVGKNIYKRRIELGMTQEELANKLGFEPEASIDDIEHGIADLPQPKVVLFAKALRTTPGKLMGLSNDYGEDYKKSAALASVAKRLQADPEFFEFVSMLADLPADEYATYKQLLAVLRNKELPNKE